MKTPMWQRSSYCATNACVEVAFAGGAVLLRDSNAPAGPVLAVSTADWRAFVKGVQAGEFTEGAEEVNG